MQLKTKFVAVALRCDFLLPLIFILLFNCPAFSKNIAVIPFQNITGDKEKNWIGAGFSETLTTKLVKVSEITVLERENLSKILEEIKFQYTGAVDEKTAVEKGKLYGADVIVFGSFQVIGDKLKVTARFVDVETRKIIDTAEANGNISDIFKLQDEIAFSLLDSLKIVLGEKEKEEVKINPTENLTAYQWYSKGEEASNLKLYDIAIENYTKAIQKNPEYAEAYYRRGNAFYFKGDQNRAIEDYTKAIQINPKYVEAYIWRGIAYHNNSEYDLAIENYTKAIQINPKYVEAYFWRKLAYDNNNEYDLAIQDCNKIIQINPKDAKSYIYRGNVYYTNGKYDLATKDYTKAIQIDPRAIDNFWGPLRLSDIFGSDDDRIKYFTKAIQINPKDAVAYGKRGLGYYNKGFRKLCISDWKKSADLGSESSRKLLKELFKIDY